MSDRDRGAGGLSGVGALCALALVVACGAEESEPAGDGPAAARRIEAGCDPGTAARRYQTLVGERAQAMLHWTGMPKEAEDLRIPVHVVAVDGGGVDVRFLAFPMREQYLHVWIGSGHVEAGEGDLFRLDPCSASLEAWSATP